MQVTEMFQKSLRTLRENPGLLLYSIVIMAVFLFLSMPMILQQGGFFTAEQGVGFYHILNLIEPFALPEAPPAGIPSLMGNVVEPGTTYDADPGNVLQGIFALGLSIFLIPAYLGITREAILYNKKPQFTSFVRYGMHYFWKVLSIILILLAITLVVGLLVGLVGIAFLTATGNQGVAAVNISLTIVMWIVFFYFLFVEMELLERGRREKLLQVIVGATNLSGKYKFKLLKCIAAFIGVGAITSLVMLALDVLPFAIAVVVIPVLNTAVLTFILVSLYHFYYMISGRHKTHSESQTGESDPSANEVQM